MAIKQMNETVTKGDFLQIGANPALYLQITGGSAPNWEGRLTNDPSGWIGGKNYKHHEEGLENAAQREMGPYATGE